MSPKHPRSAAFRVAVTFTICAAWAALEAKELGATPGEGDSVPNDPAVVAEPEDAPVLDRVVVTAAADTEFDDTRNSSSTGGHEAKPHGSPSASVPGLLESHPGVTVQTTGPGQGAPILRGLLGSSVLVMVDDVRLNTAFFRPSPNQFYGLVDALAIDEVEVIQGPSSSLHGTDAMGGVIRLVTHLPRFESPDWQLRTRGLLLGASADRSWTSRIALDAGRRGIALGGGLTYERHGDLRSGEGVQRPTAFGVNAANGALLLSAGNTELELRAQYLVQPETPRYDAVTAGFGETQPEYGLFVFEPNSRLSVHGRVRISDSHRLLSEIRIDSAFQRIRDDRRYRELDSAAEVREENRSDSLSVVARLTSLVGRRMRLRYGAEATYDQIESHREGREGSTAIPMDARYADGSSIQSYAVYAQDEVKVHPRVTLSAGARASVFVVRIPAADRGVGMDLLLPDVTGDLGMSVRLSPSTHLLGNLGRGLRVPNVHDLSSLGPRPGKRFQEPNPGLGPEEVLAGDLGVRYRGLRAHGEVFAFHSLYRDKIEVVPTGGLTMDGRFVVRSENVEQVRLLGAAVAGGFSLSPRVRLSGSLSWTLGSETGSDGTTGPADRVPPLGGRAGIEVFAHRRLALLASLAFAAGQSRLSERDRGDPRIDPSGTGGWTRWDVRARFTASEYLRVDLALENLLDDRYRVHGSGIDAPGFNAVASLDLTL